MAEWWVQFKNPSCLLLLLFSSPGIPTKLCWWFSSSRRHRPCRFSSTCSSVPRWGLRFHWRWVYCQQERGRKERTRFNCVWNHAKGSCQIRQHLTLSPWTVFLPWWGTPTSWWPASCTWSQPCLFLSGEGRTELLRHCSHCQTKVFFYDPSVYVPTVPVCQVSLFVVKSLYTFLPKPKI